MKFKILLLVLGSLVFSVFHSLNRRVVVYNPDHVEKLALVKEGQPRIWFVRQNQDFGFLYETDIGL